MLRMSEDTAPEAAAAHVAVLRRATTEQRLRSAFAYSRSMIALSRAALRDRHPDLGDDECLVLWVEQNYGPEIADGVRRRVQELGWTRATNSSRR
jgi:hypothetical protein